jgi:DNA polymerase V
VFVETSRFNSQAQYTNSVTHVFDLPTSDTAQLIQAAQRGLQKIFKAGLSYQRAGILLPDLLPVGVAQMSLFEDSALSDRSEHLMVALDSINRKHGKQTICYGSELLSKHWQRRQQFKSPSYTTNWQEVLTICI